MNRLALRKLKIGDKVQVNTNCNTPRSWHSISADSKGIVLLVRENMQDILFFNLIDGKIIEVEAKYLDVIKEFKRAKRKLDQNDSPF